MTTASASLNNLPIKPGAGTYIYMHRHSPRRWVGHSLYLRSVKEALLFCYVNAQCVYVHTMYILVFDLSTEG